MHRSVYTPSPQLAIVSAGGEGFRCELQEAVGLGCILFHREGTAQAGETCKVFDRRLTGGEA